MMIKRSTIVLLFLAFVGMAGSANAVLIGASNGNLFDLNVATNTSTLIGNSGQMFDIALDPTTGLLYGVSLLGTELVLINTTTAAATFIGNTEAGITGLTFDSVGTLYGSGGTNLYTLSLVSGLATTVGSTGFTSSGDIAFDSSGNLFLSALSDPGGGPDRLVSLDSSNGTGTLIGVDIGFADVFGLNFDGSTLHGFTSAGKTIAINTTTGLGTFLANNGINAFGATVSVPEPSTLALLAAGLIGLAYRRRVTP